MNKIANARNNNENEIKGGKVIRNFTAEFLPSEADSSDEEREREFVDIFGVLWAETCRERENN